MSAETKRYTVVAGSQSGHCCFDYTVVDTTRPTGYKDEYEAMCECFDKTTAETIRDALNKEGD